MKKIILLVAVAMMAVTGVEAQSDVKHEIGVTYGWVSNSDWLSIFESAASAVVGEVYDEGLYVGPVSLEYFYHVEPWFGVGAIAAYGMLSEDILKNNNTIGKHENRYVTIMPAAKFEWLRRDFVGLYSKLGVGMTWRGEKVEYDDKSVQGRDDSGFHVNFQVSFIGCEVGKSLRGFAEWGVGEQGMLVVGARYKF